MGAIKNWQSRETGNTGYTICRETKQKHNTICVGQCYMQTNTNNINKTWTLLQTTGGKDKPNVFLYAKIIKVITTFLYVDPYISQNLN